MIARCLYLLFWELSTTLKMFHQEQLFELYSLEIKYIYKKKKKNNCYQSCCKTCVSLQIVSQPTPQTGDWNGTSVLEGFSVKNFSMCITQPWFLNLRNTMKLIYVFLWYCLPECAVKNLFSILTSSEWEKRKGWKGSSVLIGNSVDALCSTSFLLSVIGVCLGSCSSLMRKGSGSPSITSSWSHTFCI